MTAISLSNFIQMKLKNILLLCIFLFSEYQIIRQIKDNNWYSALLKRKTIKNEISFNIFICSYLICIFHIFIFDYIYIFKHIFKCIYLQNQFKF